MTFNLRKHCFLIFAAFCLQSAAILHSQEISEIEFRNQPLADIVRSLGVLGDVTVVPDETVIGNRTYFFQNTDFPTALSQVLLASDLYNWTENGIMYVSRLLVQRGSGGEGVATPEVFSVKGIDIPIQLLLQRLGQTASTTIIAESLPNFSITIFAESLPLAEILQIVAARVVDYELISEGSFYSFRRKPPQTAQAAAANSQFELRKNPNGNYFLSGNNLSFKEAIERLFQLEGKEYLFLKRADTQVDRIFVLDAPYAEILRILLNAGDADIVESNSIQYILDMNRAELAKQYEIYKVVPVKYISVADLPNLFPTGLISMSNFKLDRDRNTIILNGTQAQIAPVLAFLQSIDTPLSGGEFRSYNLKYISPQKLLELLPETLKNLRPIIDENANAVVVYTDEESGEELHEFILQVDRPGKVLPVRLQYIRAADLIENLPPSIQRSDLVQTPDPLLLLYQGTDESFANFMEQVQLFDKPAPQIRYQLLVIQYQSGSGLDWNPTLNISTNSGQNSSLIGSLGSLLSLSFDVVTVFGLTFGADLSAKLDNSTASIFVDTTLTGLSGQELSFQNTNTYRYRDAEIDPDTQLPKNTGITREITSGFILEISGWVSGNNMVTMEISTTISKRDNSPVSSTSPPPTSEKILTTHVRTFSGTPVVIGGLVQGEENKISERTPLLGEIPGLGDAISKSSSSQANTEMVIYILPYVEYPEAETSLDASLMGMYHSVFPDEP